MWLFLVNLDCSDTTGHYGDMFFCYCCVFLMFQYYSIYCRLKLQNGYIENEIVTDIQKVVRSNWVK